LSDDHLAWFVIDAVDELDMAGFDESYRLDGRRAAASVSRTSGSAWWRPINVMITARSLGSVYVTPKPSAGCSPRCWRVARRPRLVRVDLVTVDGTKMRAIRTARSRTSNGNGLPLLGMAPSSQRIEPPRNPGALHEASALTAGRVLVVTW
jgi:hypothetical protein